MQRDNSKNVEQQKGAARIAYTWLILYLAIIASVAYPYIFLFISNLINSSSLSLSGQFFQYSYFTILVVSLYGSLLYASDIQQLMIKNFIERRKFQNSSEKTGRWIKLASGLVFIFLPLLGLIAGNIQYLELLAVQNSFNISQILSNIPFWVFVLEFIIFFYVTSIMKGPNPFLIGLPSIIVLGNWFLDIPSFMRGNGYDRYYPEIDFAAILNLEIFQALFTITLIFSGIRISFIVGKD